MGKKRIYQFEMCLINITLVLHRIMLTEYTFNYYKVILLIFIFSCLYLHLFDTEVIQKSGRVIELVSWIPGPGFQQVSVRVLVADLCGLMNENKKNLLIEPSLKVSYPLWWRSCLVPPPGSEQQWWPSARWEWSHRRTAGRCDALPRLPEQKRQRKAVSRYKEHNKLHLLRLFPSCTSWTKGPACFIPHTSTSVQYLPRDLSWNYHLATDNAFKSLRRLLSGARIKVPPPGQFLPGVDFRWFACGW